ncbi:hypothetical protein ANN_16146 [Periplaneta americana]|uniref:PiggyBac transposable element-derived protein domain-containing protein n=1 Tax=Periplaneta americana TaxID=6978 RepID=A0ABQ8SIX6_PERAM|nr:hypothetical protein ANN_16146 [Periplaneta americana]
MQGLTNRRLGATGTLRENRITDSINLPDKKSWKKVSRGEIASSTCNDLLVVRWNKNSVVTVLTNYHPVDPLRKASRYSRADRKKISVNVPGPVAQYNTNMGGVDIGDQFIGTYVTASILRTSLCSRMASVS